MIREYNFVRVMVLHWILASRCLVPSHINCVLSVFSLRWVDVIHWFISSVHVVMREYRPRAWHSFRMTIKLRVVRVWVWVEYTMRVRRQPSPSGAVSHFRHFIIKTYIQIGKDSPRLFTIMTYIQTVRLRILTYYQVIDTIANLFIRILFECQVTAM